MPNSDGQVVYDVRANDNKIESDLNSAGQKIEKHASKWDSVLTGVGHAIGANITNMVMDAADAVWELGSGFESGLAKVSTLVDTASVDMGALGDSLLDLSSKYGIEAQGLAESAYNAISSNNALAKDTAGLMAVLESSTKLAKAGFTDVDTATSATLKTLNAYGLGVEEADRIQKILIQTQNVGITTVGELGSVLAQVTPTAAAMGVSFENVGAALGTMTAQGTPAAQATTQLNSLFAELGKNGTQAALALEEATEGTQYAGMSFQELTAAGVPLNEILGLMDASAKKNGVTMLDMFSSIEAGKAALAMTGQGAQTFTQNLAAMSTELDVVTDGYNKVAGTASEQLNMSLTKISNAAIQLYQSIQPIIAILLSVVATILEKVQPSFNTFTEKIQSVISKAEQFKPVIEDVFKKIKGWIDETIPKVQQFFDPLIDSFQRLADRILPPLLDAFSSLKSLFSTLSTVLSPLLTKARDLYIVFSDKIAPAISSVIQLFTGLINGVNKAVQAVGNFFGINTSGSSRSHAVGADYIPYDNYPAVLHQGEAVLTAAEAKAWRAGINSRDSDAVAAGAWTGGIDYDKLARAMSGLRVVMDGKTVGRLVEPSVSTAQARKLESMQRSGFNGRV